MESIVEKTQRLLAAATPGPWAVAPEIDGTEKLTRIKADNRVVARTQSLYGRPHVPHDQEEANAALIAAVPELLAGLLAEVQAAEQRGYKRGWGVTMPPAH